MLLPAKFNQPQKFYRDNEKVARAQPCQRDQLRNNRLYPAVTIFTQALIQGFISGEEEGFR
jgi:hypothetical protein